MTTVTGTRPHTEPVVKLRHPARWLSYVVLAVLLAMLVNTLVNNPRFEWSVVGHYFISSQILHGLVKTIELTVIAMVTGIALGMLLAVMRLSRNPAMSALGAAYVWLFRGTPVFVHVLFWGYISALYPRLSLGIPFGPHFVSGNMNSLITPFVAAILGLGLNEGAYMVRYLPRRNHLGRYRADRSSPSAGYVPLAHPAPDSAPAGDAGHHSAEWQRDDFDAQDDFPG